MHKIRRSDREIEKEEALDIVERGEFGVLSTVGIDHQPYGVPINFCTIDGCIYFHCALEGRKIENITHNPKVSFCVVGKTCVLPSKFSTEYESAIVFGVLAEVFEDEKQTALEGLLKKYSSNYLEEGLKYLDAQKKKTRVFKLTVETITGKSRR